MDVTADGAYRELVERVLPAALDTALIEVTGVAWEQTGAGSSRSWLCFAADPAADDRMAAMTMSTAADHLALIDPNGIGREAGARLDCSVETVELADEAALQVRAEDGKPTLISPWTQDLAVVKVTFTYRPAA